jgi:hypothetical protein
MAIVTNFDDSRHEDDIDPWERALNDKIDDPYVSSSDDEIDQPLQDDGDFGSTDWLM